MASRNQPGRISGTFNIDHDNTRRPNLSLDQQPPEARGAPPVQERHLRVVKSTRCDGLINEYQNAA